jgi:hypothetical protein
MYTYNIDMMLIDEFLEENDIGMRD